MKQTANPGEFTLTRTGDITNPLTVNYTLTGKATNEADYAKLSGSVVIPAGQTQVAIVVDVIDDGKTEYREAATINLSGGLFYSFNTDKSATVTIADNDRPVVSIQAIDPNAAETVTEKKSNPGKLRIRRAGDLINPLTVNYKVSGSATKGSDYELPSTITIPAGKDSVDLPMTIIDDSIAETLETATVTLVAKTNYKVAVSARSGIVSIADND